VGDLWKIWGGMWLKCISFSIRQAGMKTRNVVELRVWSYSKTKTNQKSGSMANRETTITIRSALSARRN